MANPAYETMLRLGVTVYLLTRSRRRKNDPVERAAARERWRPAESLDLPEDKPIYWLHAVSVGEVGVAGVLAREIVQQQPEAVIVLTTSTATGVQAAKDKVPQAAAILLARYDFRRLVASMFDVIHPAALILIEGDLWRNLIAIATRRHVPVFIANAKLSEGAAASYHHFALYARALLRRITYVYAQTHVYQDRLVSVGLDPAKCEVTGNVKLDTLAPEPSPDELAQIARQAGCMGRSPIIVFGSLHPGEEEIALAAMQRLWEHHPQAHGLIAPRHIERTPQMAETLRSRSGEAVRIYSSADDAPRDARITLVDQMGLLMKLYALCDIAVVGGTFVGHVGGHNLTEPCFYGKPVLYGPYVHTQQGFHELIQSYTAGFQVAETTFPDTLLKLADSPVSTAQIGANGARMIAESRGVAHRITADILQRTGAATQANSAK